MLWALLITPYYTVSRCQPGVVPAKITAGWLIDPTHVRVQYRHSTRQTSTTPRTSASLPYTLGKCVVGYKEGTCLIGVGRKSDIMLCSWKYRLYERVWEHSGRIALLKCWANVLCTVGSVKYIRYKTTRALKLFQEIQSWVPHCTYVAYFTNGVLLRTGTNETDVRKQTDVADWWNCM